jgi:hypothetical protein
LCGCFAGLLDLCLAARRLSAIQRACTQAASPHRWLTASLSESLGGRRQASIARKQGMRQPAAAYQYGARRYARESKAD